jgi:hypothetical protein
MRNGKTGRNLFTLLLLAFVLLNIFVSFNYSYVSRRMTIYFGIPLTVMLVLVFLSDNYAIFSVLKINGRFFVSPGAATGNACKKNVLAQEILLIFLIISFFVMIYFWGFLISIPIFTFVYLRLYARESWLTSSLISAGTVFFVFFIFVHALKLRL